MDRKNQIILCCAVLAMGLGVAFSSQAAAPGQEVSELKVEIHEWQGPTKGAHPHDPAVGPDGALWFTEQMANKLGRLDPATGAFKEYPLVEGKNSGPHGLVADTEGKHLVYSEFWRLYRETRSAHRKGDAIQDAG